MCSATTKDVLEATFIASNDTTNTAYANSGRGRPAVIAFTPTRNTVLGLALLLLFALQYILGLVPDWLLTLQNNTVYRQISGFVLLGFICLQWRYALGRLQNQTSGILLRRQHEYYGVLAPLVFYIHSVGIGYAYQMVLTALFLGNCLVGNLNPKVFRVKTDWYYCSWLISHIGMSITVVVLLGYHIYIVYTY